jgi:hypothetical protein
VSGQEDAATKLADAVEPKLGTTDTQEMTGDIRAVVGKAPLALVVGQDDADVFGGENPAP